MATTSTTPLPSAPALTADSKLDEILHALVVIGISAASIFVKNANSRVLAGQLINVINTNVLPLADALLNPPVPPAAS